MPVVINEIQIIANVVEQAGQGSNRPAAVTNGVLPAEQMEKIVRVCVEEIFRILKEKEER